MLLTSRIVPIVVEVRQPVPRAVEMFPDVSVRGNIITFMSQCVIQCNGEMGTSRIMMPVEPDMIGPAGRVAARICSVRGLGRTCFVPLRVTPSGTVNLLDLPTDDIARSLARIVLAPDARRGPVTVAFMNMRNYMAVRRDPLAVSVFAWMDQVYPDGVGLQIARHLMRLPSFPRVSGTDTVPLMMKHLQPGTRVFLLGGTPALSATVAERFGRCFPSLVLAGRHHGYVDRDDDDRVAAAISAARADLLLIGMGSPLQETWLQRNHARLDVRLAVCVGGLFHYWADDLRRAPALWRSIGLEWLWILVQQPHKWRTYSIDAARFGAAVVRLRRSGPR